MFGIASIFCIVAGTVVAQRAERYQAPAHLMEIVGGLLLIGGLAMLGIELAPVAQAVNF